MTKTTNDPVYIGRTKEDFHGMPKGTEVMVLSQYRDIQDSLISVCVRTDGKDIPNVDGDWKSGRIADDLIEEIKQ